MRLQYGRTVLLGLAFLGVQALFGIYNAYVPIFLQSGRPDFSDAGAVSGGFGLGAALTGLIMTFDNLAAILILPYIGALSDATSSRLGKRKPYILFGAPITAAAFVAIPLLLGQRLPWFILAIIIMVLAVDIIRTPILALMPDITPSPLRSQANGVIYTMGGIGGVIALLVGGALYRQSSTTPFVLGAATLLIGCLLVVTLLPVPTKDAAGNKMLNLLPQIDRTARGREAGAFQHLRMIWRDSDRSMLFLLGAIFCWFLAFSVLTVFFTSFATVSLQVQRGQESQLLAFFSLAIIVFSLPSGLIGGRIGRKRAVIAGLVLFAVAMGILGLVTNLWLVRGLLALGGIGWALIIVNSLPMVIDSAALEHSEQVGTYTGLYFLATQAAEVIGPVLAGTFIDLTGRNYRFIFAYAVVLVVVALLLMGKVRRGEGRTA